MRVTLQKIRPSAGSILECMPYLDDVARQLVTTELERTAFQRTYADLHFTLSNLSDTFTTYFKSLARTDLSELCVYDDTGTRRFWGHVDPESVVFRLRDKWVEFDAFSSMKRFWELAKITELYQPDAIGLGMIFGTTVTLNQLFNYQATYTPIRDSGTTFSGINLGDYANETVRAFGNSADYGNKGRFQDLEPGTTWYEYLTALALFFNAEFYIDPQTYELKMIQRGAIHTNTLTDLDTIIHDDEEIRVRMLDSRTCDYIYSHAVVEPDPPQYLRSEAVVDTAGGMMGLEEGLHAWLLTYIVDGAECLRSERMEYTLTGSAPHKVWLYIPAGPTGTDERRLYRKDVNDTTGTFREVKRWTNNTPQEAYDNIGYMALVMGGLPLPDIDSTAGAWYAFDELTNTWDAPVLDLPKGKNKPVGVVLDIAPQLRFTEPGQSDVVRDYSPIEVYKHFLQNFNITESATRARWIDVFRTRRIIEAKVTGVGFDVGDTFTSEKNLFPNDFTTDNRMILRKIEADILSGTSRLSLMTI